MIRKMLVLAAAVAMPAATIAGISAVAASGVAAAGAPAVHASTCTVSGNVAFATGGTTEGGSQGTAKTSTSTTTLTGSGAGCFGPVAPLVTPITQKTSKCSATTLAVLPPSAGLLAGSVPSFTHFAGCVASPKDTTWGSAWGFLGGVQVNGVYQNTTAGILGALKKGVPYTDNGVALTLLVSSVTAIQPGGVCGGEAGFQLAGTVKKAATHTWNLNLCLAGDTGTATTNSFINDLLQEVSDTIAGGPLDGISIATAIVDPASSVLNIT